MRKLGLALAAGLAGLSLTAGVAHAAAIIYIFTGVGSWTLGGTPESGDFTVKIFSDTSTIVSAPPELANAGNGIFSGGGTTVKLTGDADGVVVNQTAPGFMGFEQVTLSPSLNVAVEALINSVFETYALTGPFPLTTGTVSTPTTATFFTSKGDLDFGEDSITSLSFQAVAPEPSTWAMMLLGFAGLGYAAYRKRGRVAVA